MSHVTYENESRHTYIHVFTNWSQYVYTWMSHVTCMNESRHTYRHVLTNWSKYVYTWMSCVTYMNESRHTHVEFMNFTHTHTHTYTHAHIHTCIEFMNESRHTYMHVFANPNKYVYTQTCHGTHMNESRHTRVEFMNGSRHTYMCLQIGIRLSMTRPWIRRRLWRDLIMYVPWHACVYTYYTPIHVFANRNTYVDTRMCHGTYMSESRHTFVEFMNESRRT